MKQPWFSLVMVAASMPLYIIAQHFGIGPWHVFWIGSYAIAWHRVYGKLNER